jgi:hypothetical protein
LDKLSHVQSLTWKKEKGEGLVHQNGWGSKGGLALQGETIWNE